VESIRLKQRRSALAWLLLPGAALGVVHLAGCGDSGPRLAPVTGRVTLDDRPLVMAEIVFQPDDSVGSPSFGITDDDGRYELGYTRDKKGALVGWHLVRITSQTESDGPRGEAVLMPQIVPARYNEATELRREVLADEPNEFHFDLTSSPE
jgi:hypothetical protein